MPQNDVDDSVTTDVFECVHTIDVLFNRLIELSSSYSECTEATKKQATQKTYLKVLISDSPSKFTVSRLKVEVIFICKTISFVADINYQ